MVSGSCVACPFASGDSFSEGKFSMVAAFGDHFASPAEDSGFVSKKNAKGFSDARLQGLLVLLHDFARHCIFQVMLK